MLVVLLTAFGLVTTPLACPPAASVSQAARAPGAPGAREDGLVQHGAQPNAGKVRAGGRDSPSASAGPLATTTHDRRILGIPVNAAIVIAGLVVVLALMAGAFLPDARRRERARGNGTYGRR